MALLGYILKQDIVTYLLGDTLDELTGGRRAIGSDIATAGNDKIWEMNLPSSIEKVLGYTRHWYDMTKESRPYREYSETEAFTVGQRIAGVSVTTVDDNGLNPVTARPLYTCILDAPAGTLLTDELFFSPIDDRNPVLVEIIAILVIYNISSRSNPRQVPEQRQINYDRVIDTLKDIQKGRIQLSIAERENVEDDDPGHEIAFGDFEDITHDRY